MANENTGAGKVEAPGQNKVSIILVNAREKEWSEKDINYDQIIVLAFGSVSNDPNVSYSATFKKGENEKPEGIMVKGDSVKVKDGMRFNVTQTNRS
jgi:hypothetical protein